jgi:hypothetical protein
MSTKKKMGRPRVLSDEERAKKHAEYQARWRKRNPWRWEKIYKRAYAKKRAKKGKGGVEVELVI